MLLHRPEAEADRQRAGVVDINETPAQATPVHKVSIPSSWDIAAALASGPHQTGEAASLSQYAAPLDHCLSLLTFSLGLQYLHNCFGSLAGKRLPSEAVKPCICKVFLETECAQETLLHAGWCHKHFQDCQHSPLLRIPHSPAESQPDI